MNLSKAKKYDVLVKEGYSVHMIEGKPTVCVSGDRAQKDQDIVKSYYLHIEDCCKRCKKKIRINRKLIEKRKRGND